MFVTACAEPERPAAAVFDDPWCANVMARVDSFAATLMPPEGPEYGGTAVAAVASELDGMNSLLTPEYNDRQHQTFVQFTTLVRYDGDLQLQPYLAESWALNEDGSELTFQLRDGVPWHDGTPTTARDVAFTYERAKNPAVGFVNSAFFQRYDSVQALDERTVRFFMTPHADPLDAWTATAIMPAHLLADAEPAELAQHPFQSTCPVGNGPFRFTEHRVGQDWTWVRNPAFPQSMGGPSRLERYVLRIIPEQSTLQTELLSGGIDMYPGMRSDQAATVQEAAGLRVLRAPNRGYYFVGWNTRRPGLSDPAVRRAIAMGVDRRGIIDGLLAGYGQVANAGVPPDAPGYDPQLADSLPYDLERARETLEGAGWVDADGNGIREKAGNELRFELLHASENIQQGYMGQIMKAQLAQIGIEIDLVGLDFTSIVARFITPGQRDFDGFFLTFTPEFKVDDHDLFHSRASDEPYAWAGMNDPTLDRLIDALALERDPARADQLWADYQNALVRLAPYTYLYFTTRLHGVSDRLNGVVVDSRGEWVSIADWSIPEEFRKYGAIRR